MGSNDGSDYVMEAGFDFELGEAVLGEMETDGGRKQRDDVELLRILGIIHGNIIKN